VAVAQVVDGDGDSGDFSGLYLNTRRLTYKICNSDYEHTYIAFFAL
jgi:hypothetical protein